MSRVTGWLVALIQDPDGSPSSSRVGALLCVVVACGLAVAGMWLNREQSATVGFLLGGGAGAYFARRKSEGSA
jgi:hypothetical protein